MDARALGPFHFGKNYLGVGQNFVGRNAVRTEEFFRVLARRQTLMRQRLDLDDLPRLDR
jgi:hypothetical protein